MSGRLIAGVIGRRLDTVNAGVPTVVFPSVMPVSTRTSIRVPSGTDWDGSTGSVVGCEDVVGIAYSAEFLAAESSVLTEHPASSAANKIPEVHLIMP